MDDNEIKPHEIIRLLEESNKRTDKSLILAGARVVDEFVEGIKMALDKLYVFNIKNIPYSTSDSSVSMSWSSFKEYANKLHNREVTGKAANELVLSMMQNTSKDVWDGWYRRILLKDLQCGVNTMTINKAYRDYPKCKIPVFKCMLAKSNDGHFDSTDYIVEAKLDGVRALAVKQDDKVKLFSRNGKEFNNFVKIEESLSYLMTDDSVWDGEIVSSDFNSLMTQVNRKRDVNIDDAVFVVFDSLPASEFYSGESSDVYSKRLADLSSILFKNHRYVNVRSMEQYSRYVKRISFHPSHDNKFKEEAFIKMSNEAAKLGFEGIMVKGVNDVYQGKKTRSWTKIKPCIQVSLTVDDMEEGTGKNKGVLGALVCSGIDDGKSIKCNVGIGFSDEDRKNLWDNKDSVIGKIAEIECDSISVSNGQHSVRFPRFVRFRGFAVGEKL